MSSSQLYYTNAWLPLHIEADVGENGELFIKKRTETPRNAAAATAEAKAGDEAVVEKQELPFASSQHIDYDLYAVVCYIHDPVNPDRKNLVALINVGPRYHERSVGSPVSQYLQRLQVRLTLIF